MFATGIIRAVDNMGCTHYLIAMFDTGSEINLIAEKCVKKRGLKKETRKVQILGITGDLMSNGMVNLQISPWFDEERKVSLSRTFMVAKSVPALRERSISKDVAEFKELLMADPQYYKSRNLDVLLGVEIWAKIVQPSIRRSLSGLCAQETLFGYAIYGSVTPIIRADLNPIQVTCAAVSYDERSWYHADKILPKIWELADESIYEPEMTVADARAEEIFRKTTRRTAEGRYIVKIPFAVDNVDLGDSKATALQRYFELEKRLQRAGARDKYDEFIQQYVKLGHMRLATSVEKGAVGYYIPQHVVLKRYRVVFDGSAATTNELSINDVQLQGPNLQEKLPRILLRF